MFTYHFNHKVNIVNMSENYKLKVNTKLLKSQYVYSTLKTLLSWHYTYMCGIYHCSNHSQFLSILVTNREQWQVSSKTVLS